MPPAKCLLPLPAPACPREPLLGSPTAARYPSRKPSWVPWRRKQIPNRIFLAKSRGGTLMGWAPVCTRPGAPHWGGQGLLRPSVPLPAHTAGAIWSLPVVKCPLLGVASTVPTLHPGGGGSDLARFLLWKVLDVCLRPRVALRGGGGAGSVRPHESPSQGTVSSGQNPGCLQAQHGRWIGRPELALAECASEHSGSLNFHIC